MTEYTPVQPIPWNLAQYSIASIRRWHFVQVLRSVQYASSTLCIDVAMFRKIFDTKSGLPQVLADGRSKQFWTLFYHVAVFEKSLIDIRGFIDAGAIERGTASGFDLEITWNRARALVEVLSKAVTALQEIMGNPENPFKDDQFVGLLTPTAAPRELLLSMIWTKKSRQHNNLALEKGEIVTEAKLRETLSEFSGCLLSFLANSWKVLISFVAELSGYPSFEELEPAAEFDRSQILEMEKERNLSNGVPNMFFICVGSATASGPGTQFQHIKIGATIPIWKGFSEFASMCRSARDIRFGPDEISKVTKAINALTAIEEAHLQPQSRSCNRILVKGV